MGQIWLMHEMYDAPRVEDAAIEGKAVKWKGEVLAIWRSISSHGRGPCCFGFSLQEEFCDAWLWACFLTFPQYLTYELSLWQAAASV